jgi:hypothetical protein
MPFAGSSAADPSSAQRVARQLLDEECRGNVEAARLVAEILDGPPVQVLEHSGPNGGPMVWKRADGRRTPADVAGCSSVHARYQDQFGSSPIGSPAALE